MTEAERTVFDTIVEHLKESGTFRPVDVYAITQAARCVVIMEQATAGMAKSGIIQVYKTGAKQVSAEMTAFKQAFDIYQKLSTALGLDPKARGLIGGEVAKDEAEDPIRSLLKKHG